MIKIYNTRGVCSQRIEIEMEKGVIKKVTFVGGCSGNTQGVSKLVAGMEPHKVISLLRGIRCGSKSTSCPDQLARALEELQ